VKDEALPEKCEKCGLSPPVVGVGPKPEWVCLKCFGGYLEQQFRPLKALRPDQEDDGYPD
jgi:hypothetical protein